ncbi:hypothetical protein Sjap_026019 [Stephania japonica]|uniref:Uncharacterized protein n=1 Tax=Stephania japonica TaxID=461633 RepID=A0AAP0E5W8_9MAGN
MKSTGDMVLIRKGGCGTPLEKDKINLISRAKGTGKGKGKGKVRGGRGSRLEGERRVEKKMGDRRRRGDREEWGVVGMGGEEDPRDYF